MAFGKNKGKENTPEVLAVPQTYGNKHPFSTLLCPGQAERMNMRLYSSLREAIPIIDASISKLIRLIGTFSVDCTDKAAGEELEFFLRSVNVGAVSTGINAFISNYLNQLLTFGTAVGEMVVDGNSIVGLYNADLNSIELSPGKNPMQAVVACHNGTGACVPVKYPQLILLSALNPLPDEVYGTSLLKGLPFVCDILMKIYNTIGTNWERIGNIRYAVTYKPQNDSGDKAFAKQRAELVARQWGKTMESSGPVKDFVAVGDVNIKVIGADNQILESEVPVRQMLEQIVAKLGIPPYILGLNWSSTERMSSQQADILTSEIEYYREIINPVIQRICRLFLRLRGYDCETDIIWNNITLQDELQLAQAKYYNARADMLFKESAGEKNEE